MNMSKIQHPVRY